MALSNAPALMHEDDIALALNVRLRPRRNLAGFVADAFKKLAGIETVSYYGPLNFGRAQLFDRGDAYSAYRAREPYLAIHRDYDSGRIELYMGVGRLHEKAIVKDEAFCVSFAPTGTPGYYNVEFDGHYDIGLGDNPNEQSAIDALKIVGDGIRHLNHVGEVDFKAMRAALIECGIPERKPMKPTLLEQNGAPRTLFYTESKVLSAYLHTVEFTSPEINSFFGSVIQGRAASAFKRPHLPQSTLFCNYNGHILQNDGTGQWMDLPEGAHGNVSMRERKAGKTYVATWNRHDRDLGTLTLIDFGINQKGADGYAHGKTIGRIIVRHGEMGSVFVRIAPGDPNLANRILHNRRSYEAIFSALKQNMLGIAHNGHIIESDLVKSFGLDVAPPAPAPRKPRV